MSETADPEEKPEVQDHRSVTGSIQYELGRAEVEHGVGDFVAVEALCYPSSDVTTEDMRPKDWMLPVYASGGRIVLRIDVTPEAAWIMYDGSELRALIWNDVFLDHKETDVDQEDLEELIEAAESVELLPRHRSRFASNSERGSE